MGIEQPETGFEKVDRALANGELKFVMEGQRLHGGWVLVRLRHEGKSERRNWLLIKHRDQAAVDFDGGALAAEDRSVASGRSMARIAAGAGKAAPPFMTEAETAADAVWDSRPSTSLAAAPPRAVRRVRKSADPPGVEPPAFIAPQLCKAVGKPPRGDRWAHEIKFDGYRMQLRTVNGKASLKTRKGLDWSAKFPAIRDAGGKLADGIVDGEIAALDKNGAPDFAALQAAIAEGQTDALIFFAFDLLYAGSEDLRPLPLAERKATRLKTLLEPAQSSRQAYRIRRASRLSLASAVLRSACRMDLEGIVSKRLDAPYSSGRGETWTKAKCRRGHEVVIGGWTTTGGKFRSLIAGVYRDDHLGLYRVGWEPAFENNSLARLASSRSSQRTIDRQEPFHGQRRAAQSKRRHLGPAEADRRD